MSNKIAIISYYSTIQGSIINLLDFNQYLQNSECKKTIFYCKNNKLQEIVRKSSRKYTFGEIKHINDIIFEPPRIAVTDFTTLVKTYIDGIPIICKKLIVFDNVELSYHLLNMVTAKYYLEFDLNKCLDFHRFKKIEFLMPPCNFFKFTERYDYHASIFFKKINVDMLKTIKIKDNRKTFFRDNFGNGIVKIPPKNYQRIQLKDVFYYNTYYYRKRKELEYFEQFGRLVFEFIMLGKKVIFEKNPLMYEDGLADYIIHYGLDKNKICEKMGEQYDYKPWKI